MARKSRGWPFGALSRACLLAAFFASAAAAPGQAQDSVGAGPASPALTPAQRDQKVFAAMERGRKDGVGAVIIGAEVPGRACTQVDMAVERIVNGKPEATIIGGVHKFLGAYKNYIPKGLRAGPWVLASVRCVSPHSGVVLHGPYAKFEVTAGEIVDVGTLKLDYAGDGFFTNTGKVRLSIGPSNEGRMAELQKRVPQSMARVRKRPMVLIGPAEQKVKRSAPGIMPEDAVKPPVAG